MQIRLQVLLVLASLAMFLIVLELIRKGRLREEYSLIWLASAAVIFVLAVFRGTLRGMADLVQINYAPSLIFMVGLGLVITIQLLQTLAISKLTVQNRELAQQLSILAWQLQWRRATDEDVALLPSHAQSNEQIAERNVIPYEEDEDAGDWPRRRHVRSTEAVGAGRNVAHPPKAFE